LAGTFVAPRWILPWFNKFTPLEEGELSRGIADLARRCGFPLAEISVMDGSQRSSKANAFFTGFGKTKRIALFDTLVKDHPVPELLAILAHEIGHYRKRHLVTGMAAGIAESALMFGLLGFFLRNEGLHAAFGVAEPSVSMGLILFGLLYTPVGKVTAVGRGMLSRRHEFEADAYAAEVTGRPEDLVAALQRLTKSSLGNVTPHPFHVFLNHTHPPVVERIRALRGRGVEKI
jgi:STE24 endopeptidase